MMFESNKDRGRMGLAMGIAYYSSQGYTISLPLNDTQWYDFIIEKDGIFQTVQCKATGSKKNNIDFRSTGGTKGAVYHNLINDNLDYLFCLNQDGIMYSIPFQDLIEHGNKQSINLRTTPNPNNQGFPTYKYMVSF
jgi:hypothetical protein